MRKARRLWSGLERAIPPDQHGGMNEETPPPPPPEAPCCNLCGGEPAVVSEGWCVDCFHARGSCCSGE